MTPQAYQVGDDVYAVGARRLYIVGCELCPYEIPESGNAYTRMYVVMEYGTRGSYKIPEDWLLRLDLDKLAEKARAKEIEGAIQ